MGGSSRSTRAGPGLAAEPEATTVRRVPRRHALSHDLPPGGAPGHAAVVEVLSGMQGVLDGARRGFFPSSTLAPVRAPSAGSCCPWYPLKPPPRAARVVSHTEVTERKRAEVQAEQTRQELAHFNPGLHHGRASGLGGARAAPAAHTAIMTNAQAARRLLDAIPPRPYLRELGEILKRQSSRTTLARAEGDSSACARC